jgi:hypothetical protein
MRIAIVGAAQSKQAAPFGDPSWSIWSCSQRNYAEVPRADLWFELHRREAIDGNTPYIAFLRGRRVLMQRHYDDIPGSAPYPIEAMVARFGRCFFQGTPCYMAAYAIHVAPAEIGIWGVEGRFPEYTRQRQALQHFVDVAEAEGIAVTCPADLRDGRLYAFEE